MASLQDGKKGNNVTRMAFAINLHFATLLIFLIIIDYTSHSWLYPEVILKQNKSPYFGYHSFVAHLPITCWFSHKL